MNEGKKKVRDNHVSLNVDFIFISVHDHSNRTNDSSNKFLCVIR